MVEDLPPQVAVPVVIVLTVAAVFVRRREIAAWLGLKEDRWSSR